MKETIVYTDYLGEPITLEALPSMGRYCKVFKDGALTKKNEEYQNNVLVSMTYFLSDTEKEQDVLKALRAKVKRYITLNSRRKQGDFAIVKSRTFSLTALCFNTQELYNEKGNLICTQDLDLVTNQPILLGTEKDLFDNNNEIIAHFDYDEKGALRDLWGALVYDEDIYEHPGKMWPMQTITGADSIHENFPHLMHENPYFKDATFFPT